MTLTPDEHRAHVEFYAQQIGPLIRSIMGTKNADITYDVEEWECFLESLTNNIRRDILWGPKTRGPFCAVCDSEGEAGEFDADHEFSPRDKTGMPPCLCGHQLAYHSRGERGEDHPQYKAIEGFVRIASRDPDNPAYVPVAMNPTYVRGMWTLLSEFEKYRTRALERFKVVRAPDAVPL